MPCPALPFGAIPTVASASFPLNWTDAMRHVHAGDVQAGFGKMVDDALTDRILIFAAIAGGQGQQYEQYCRNSHY